MKGSGKPILLIVLSLVLGNPVPVEAGENPSAHRQEKRFGTVIQRSVALRYLLYLPAGYNAASQRWPLILYLHGGRGRGDDLAKVGWYPVPRMLDEGKHDIPFIVVVPQCPAGETWTDTDALAALVDEVVATHAVDPARVYLIGYSMGGHGAWYLAYKHPERFAAVAPMSGPANPWWAGRLKDIPFWVFHGAGDDTIPPRESEEMVQALREAGGNVRFTLHPTRRHSPPSEPEHLELFQWLLQQRKVMPQQ
ncbi:MAG: alpha/beta fold hydrolase [Acidobacteria bacterium]|nr:alpha/beta fold hydrolase [Acidobacteriota bacterium]